MVQVEPPPLNALSISAEPAAFPVGAAHRAIRSPRGNDARSHPPLVNQDSFSSDKDESSDSLAASGSCGSLDVDHHHQQPEVTKEDMAKRAQIRVTERKRTEIERKNEQEKLRMKKQESDKVKRDQQQQLKQRRRAEIYALNAILRQLQQEKMAAFIHAHKHSSQTSEHATGSFVSECNETSLVQSIGV